MPKALTTETTKCVYSVGFNCVFGNRMTIGIKTEYNIDQTLDLDAKNANPYKLDI